MNNYQKCVARERRELYLPKPSSSPVIRTPGLERGGPGEWVGGAEVGGPGGRGSE